VLESLANIAPNVLNIIIYNDSASIEYISRGIIKDRFEAHKDFVFDLDNTKKIMDVKSASYVSPLYGSKWLIHVNADKMSKSDLLKLLKVNSKHCLTVYWTTKYFVYKWLISHDEVKKQGVYSGEYYLGKLSESDIYFVRDRLGVKKDAVDKKVMLYLHKNYRYDPQAVCNFFMEVKSGAEVKTDKDVIDVIGLGKNSVDNFVVSLLSAKSCSVKSVSKALRVLNELSSEYKYNTIRSYMLSTLEGFLDMKVLQLSGYYKGYNASIPDYMDTKRLSRLKRFEYCILEEISMQMILNLKLALLSQEGFNYEVSLIKTVIVYLKSIEGVVEVDSKTSFRRYRRGASKR